MNPTNIFRHALFAVVMFVAVALQGCAGVPTDTANDKEAIALRSITAMRTTSTALLRAGKVTVADDQAVQLRADQIRATVVAARSIIDPVLQAQKLQDAKAEADKATVKLGGTVP